MLRLFPILCSVPTVVFAGLAFFRPDEALLAAPFVLVFLGVAVWSWRRALRTARRVAVRPGSRIEFVTGLGRVTVAPQDIISIRPDGSYLGYLVVRHRGGRVLLINQFTGFHRFLSELVSVNPAVELLGC
jgi:hypothetical protein